jgi:tyrosyl-tRNA synthetase
MVTGVVNPRDLKMILGKELVTMYHNKRKADKAEANFIAMFQKNEIPKDVPHVDAEKGSLLVDVLLSHKLVSSKTEFRRLVDEKAITNLDTNEKITDYSSVVTNAVYRIGKKRFCKIVLK